MARDNEPPRGLNILCIDGGGVRGLSSLLLLNDIMKRTGGLGIDEKGAPLYPADYFDIIAGSGTGGVSACMLGRLRMPIDQTITAYTKLMEKVFSDKKVIGTSGPSEYKGTTLRAALKSIVRDTIGNEDEKMKKDQEQENECKTMVFAMSKQGVSAGKPVIFRSYDSSAFSTPNCTIWETLYATMAHPDLFKSIDIDEDSIQHSFIGGDVACSNPIAHVLAEVRRMYPDRHVSCILSIGTGNSSAIQIPTPSFSQRFLRTRTVIAARNIATDSQREAEAMAARFQEVPGMYYRFTVNKGMQDINLDDWKRLSEVTVHTQNYTNKVDTSRTMELATETIQGRRPAISVAYIDGSIHISVAKQMATVIRCPAPTPVFTGREAEILQIGTCIAGSADERRVCVVHGLGGAGKTQLALKAIERNLDRWTHVLYIDASSKEAIEISLQGYARAKEIGATHEDTLNWLESLREPWLLAFDNADHPALAIEEYFPSSNHGSILITTRLIELAIHAKGPDPVSCVSGMSRQDALALLLNVSRKHDQQLAESEMAAADALLEDFGHLALAIVHAGAYIGHCHMSISEYREHFLTQRRSALERYAKLKVKVDQYEKSVYTTWKMCYDQLEENGSSRSLLWLLAFLHHNGITEDIFERAAIHMRSYEPVLPPTEMEAAAFDYVKQYLDRFLDSNGQWDTIRFSEAINELASYSLIQFDRANSAYSAHVLVQDWARTAIPLQLDFALECTTTLLSRSIGGGETTESLNFKRKVVLHVTKVLTDRGSDIGANYGLSFSSVYRENGQWNRGEALIAYVKEARARLLGSEHPDTLLSMSNLAYMYGHQGRLNDAAALGMQVLDASTRIIGEEHPDTLTSMSNLAIVCSQLGWLADAEPLTVRALDLRKRVLGEVHPDTLSSMNNLASIYSSQGRWGDAEALKAQVLNARKQVLGEEHPETLVSMNNLATTYSQLGRFNDAETLMEQAHELRKRVLGEEHPDTLITMSNLAYIYSQLDRWDDTEVLEAKILDTRKRILGEEHPDTLLSMHNLASTYSLRGRWDDAEALMVQALDGRRRILGEEHPETLFSLNNLGYIYSDKGRWDDALALKVQALNIRRRVLGELHPDTLASMNNLASTYMQQGRWIEAEGLHMQVLNARKQILGDEHPDTLASMNNLARTYAHQGRWGEAEATLTQAVATWDQMIGSEQFPGALMSRRDLETVRSRRMAAESD